VKKGSSRPIKWITFVWAVNAAGLLTILFGAVFYLWRKSIVFPQSDGALPGLSRVDYPATTSPLIDYLATSTLNPYSTPYVEATITPFVLEKGPRPVIIGYSVSGRPLETYTFGQGERQVMIVAGIHGGYEGNTTRLADELILYIVEHPEIIPSDAKLYILRNMNPDGAARGNDIHARVNDHGVDLNRNFPVNWQAEWDRKGCWDDTETTGGTGPGSEPETRAMVNFLASHRVQALISYHSAALGVFPGGEPWDEDSKRFAKELSKATGYPYPPIDTGCYYTGTLADYGVSLGATAVDMELANHKDTDFKENLRVLKVLLEWRKE